VQRLAQVFIGSREPEEDCLLTLIITFSSMYGPFLRDLPIYLLNPKKLNSYLIFRYTTTSFSRLLLRLRIILLLLTFRGFLVFPPFASTPVGEQGCLPPFDLPSPPPIG
jgi:hypothetical protein